MPRPTMKLNSKVIHGQTVEVKVYPAQESWSEQEPFEYLSYVSSGQVGDLSRQFNVLEWWLYETEDSEEDI